MSSSLAKVESQENPKATFAKSQSVFDDLTTLLGGTETKTMRFDEIENLLAGKGRELIQQLFQDHLELRALREERQAKVDGSDGKTRTKSKAAEKQVDTLFGQVKAKRQSYSVSDGEGEPLRPLDAALNLPDERYSLGLRKSVAIEASRGSFKEAGEAIERLTGKLIGNRQLEELTVRAALDFSAFYQASEVAARTRSIECENILVISTDATGISVIDDALRSATKKAKEKALLEKVGSEPADDLRNKERPNRRRMAQVATVYDVEAFVRTPFDVGFAREKKKAGTAKLRPRPENKRVWASVSENEKHVIDEAFSEAVLRDPGFERRWVVLVDGKESQLAAIKEKAKEVGVDLTIIVDFIHVLEYLHKAGKCFCPAGSQLLEDWLEKRILDILEGRAGQVAGGIRRSATKRKLSSDDRANADKCANYLAKYKKHLRYNEYLQTGFPIGTGVIEGACRYLVKDRMDITGARWGLLSAEAVLQIRSLRSSGDFEDYWAFHVEQEHKRTHVARYFEGTVPDVESKPSTLRLIHGG